MIHFTKTTLKEIEPLRFEYLQKLPFFQDIYLEFMVAEGECYIIQNQEELIGYIIANNENILLEYYIKERYIPQNSSILNLCIQKFKFNSIYCKSFDHTLLDACLLNGLSHEIIGLMYRETIKAPNFFTGELTVKMATEKELSFLMEQDDEVFEPKNQLAEMVKNKCIQLYYLKQNLIGCGFVTQVHPNWNYYDLGYWVQEDFRGKGFAKQILSYLLEYCKNNEFVPIVGCDINNTISQKILEDNGFISRFKLIQFITKK